jgi:hypothetical protein
MNILDVKDPGLRRKYGTCHASMRGNSLMGLAQIAVIEDSLNWQIRSIAFPTFTGGNGSDHGAPKCYASISSTRFR